MEDSKIFFLARLKIYLEIRHCSKVGCLVSMHDVFTFTCIFREPA